MLPLLCGVALAWPSPSPAIAQKSEALAEESEVLSAEVLVPADASTHYEQALVRFEEDDLEGSLMALKKALSADPSHLSAHILLARVYLRAGQSAAAIDALLSARRLGADPAITWPIRAAALAQGYRFEELLELVPDTGMPPDVQSELLVHRARAYMHMSDFDSAEESYRKAAELAPDASPPRVGLVHLALERSDPRTAEALAQDVQRLAPDDAGAWSAQGAVRHALGDLDGALVAYARAVELDASHYDARIARLGVLVDLGRTEAAGEDLAYMRDRYPLDPRVAYLESVHLSKQGRRADAREALERAAALVDELPPSALEHSPRLELLAGIASFETGEFEQAQRYLSSYMERYPDQAGARKLVGAIMVKQRRGDEAIQMLEPVLRRSPNDPRLLALLGEAYMLKRRHDVATTYFEKAVELSGDWRRVRSTLALNRIAGGHEDRGLRELAELFAEDPAGNTGVGVTLVVAYMQRRHHAEALEIATQLRELSPDNLTVSNLAASAQLASGRLEEAAASYRGILEQHPDFLPARVNLGQLEISRGMLDEARGRFEGILEDHPENARAMIGLAATHERRNELAAAERWTRKAHETDPDSVRAAIGLVDLLLRIGKPEEALRVAEEVEVRVEDDLEVMAALGRAQLVHDRVDLAGVTYKRMVDVAGFDTHQLYRIARLQLTIGAGDEALYTLAKALQGDAAHLPSRIALIETRLRYGRRSDALAAAEALAVERPELAVSHRLLGDALLTAGEAQAAIAAYQAALEREAAVATLLRLVRALARAGDAAGAREALEKWLADRPHDVLARLALAEHLLASDELEGARRHYERLLAVAPDSPQVLNNLAYILDRQGEPEALDLARRAHRASPADPAVNDTLGWMLVRRGQPSEGLRYLRDAQSRASASAEIRYHLASALAALAREDEARRELERALASGTDFEGAEEARALLERLSP